jgi:predicted Rossmann fold flavoprotein
LLSLFIFLCLMQKQLIVIGGGAAGFFCAVNAAAMNPSLKVIIIEKTSKLLSKVKVSGGGRCNVTHACFGTDELVKRYPRGKNFLKKAFHWFNTTGTIKWFEERGVKLKTEPDGRMFPVTDSSQTIIDCLLREANKLGIEIIMNAEVKSIEFSNNQFSFQTSGSRELISDFCCIASGGYPKPAQFNWLKQLGHSIEDPVPSLFTFNMPGNPITALMGVSVEEARVKVMGSKLEEKGPLLITHWGMSGPAVLKTSAWGARELAGKNYHFKILVNWLKDQTEQTLRDDWQGMRDRFSVQKISGKNPFGLPGRLWNHFLSQSGIDEGKRWGDITAKEQNSLIRNLTACEFDVKGKTTFREEFVTCGGIRLAEVDANTMQSRIVPHLFFAGEVLDIDGITGGFNFQHAWTSGYIAAKAITSLSAE